jgi:hypothetical protein
LAKAFSRRIQCFYLKPHFDNQGVAVEIETNLVCGSTMMPAERLEYQTPI